VRAGQTACPKTVAGEVEMMTQYLVAIHHPDGSSLLEGSEKTI
jgi:hypothetical protein